MHSDDTNILLIHTETYGTKTPSMQSSSPGNSSTEHIGDILMANIKYDMNNNKIESGILFI